MRISVRGVAPTQRSHAQANGDGPGLKPEPEDDGIRFRGVKGEFDRATY